MLSLNTLFHENTTNITNTAAPEIIMPGVTDAVNVLHRSILDIVNDILPTANNILVFLLGFVLAALVAVLVLYAISALLNAVVSLFTGQQTVAQLMAKSLGKTAGRIVVAWQEGWAAAVDKNDGNSEKQVHKMQLEEAPVVRRPEGMMLAADRSIPETKEEFQPITDVRPAAETEMATHEQDKKLEEDGELVANNWTREL